MHHLLRAATTRIPVELQYWGIAELTTLTKLKRLHLLTGCGASPVNVCAEGQCET
jgi:hypothetical protein